MGGGLGHLTRARAFLHTLGLEDGAALFTASPFARDARVVGELPVVPVPASLDGDRAGLRAFLERTLAEREAKRLVVDALPAGILGELAGFRAPAGLEVWHVARLLRWDRYAAHAEAELPRFETTWRVEDLHDDHERALASASACLRPLELRDPPSPPPEPIEPPYALVVHSGPAEETLDLVAHARELLRAGGRDARIVLAAPVRPDGLPEGVVWRDVYPAGALFAGAERIVAAAGFNVVRQTARSRAKRFLVPFPRRFDDQFTRAARAR